MQEIIPKINASNITSYAAVGAIVQADCNIKLAAENFDTDESTLVTLVCSDIGAGELLQQQLRTRVLLKTYNAFNVISSHVLENIENFEPKELTKLFGILSSVLVEYLKTPNNSTEGILKSLPEDVQLAVQNLLNQAS